MKMFRIKTIHGSIVRLRNPDEIEALVESDWGTHIVMISGQTWSVAEPTDDLEARIEMWSRPE